MNYEIIFKLNKKLPIDLIKNLYTYIPRSLSDENFTEAIKLWFSNKNECIRIYGHISNWNTINMSAKIYGKSKFNENISNWNVSNATNLKGMFHGAKNFNQKLNNWNISNFTTMDRIFFRVEKFDQEFNNWNLSKNKSDIFLYAINFNKSDINNKF